MSIRYSIAKSALRVLGFKKMFQLPLNRLIIKAEHLNKNRNFQIPKNRKYIYNDIPIMNGKYHCLSIQKHQQRTEKAIFDLLIIDLLWWRNTKRIRFTKIPEKELYQNPQKHIQSFIRGFILYLIIAIIDGYILTLF